MFVMYPYMPIHWSIPYPKGAYRCLILELESETATFQETKNKRLINALYNMSAPASLPISGLRRRYATANLKTLNEFTKFFDDFFNLVVNSELAC